MSTDIHDALKFLGDFASERLFWGLADFDLAAWELPLSSERATFSALSTKDPTIANNDGTDDVYLLLHSYLRVEA